MPRPSTQTALELIGAFAIWLGLMAWAAPGHGMETISLTAEQEPIPAHSAAALLEDPIGRWTIDDVSHPGFSGRFAPMPSGVHHARGIELGVTASAWWIRLSVRAASEEAGSHIWVMTVANPWFAGTIDCYTPHSAGGAASPGRWRIQHLDTAGTHRDDLRHFFELPLSGTKPQTIYLRVESDAYIFIPTTFSTAEYTANSRRQEALIEGLFFSTILVFGIFNLFVFLWLRDRSSFWQLLFVVAISYYFAITSSVSIHCIVVDFLGPMSFAYLQVAAICAIIIICILFTQSFLQTRAHTPRLHKLLVGYLWLNILVTCCLPVLEIDYKAIFPIWRGLMTISPLLTPLATIIPGMVRLRQGFKPARLYLLAWGSFALGTFLFALPIDIGVHGWQLFKTGCCLNVALLAFALVYRHRELQAETVALSSARDTAEAALSQSEERFRTLADSTTAHIAIVQQDRLVYANETFIKATGMNWETLKQAPLSTIFSTETIEANRRAQTEAERQSKQQFRYESRDRRGRRYEVSAQLVEVDGAEALISTSFNITERKRAEQQMFRAEKMAALGQIIAGVAHEINNPNNFIYFNLPILKKYVDTIKPLLDDRAAQEGDLRVLNLPYEAFIEDLYKLIENMQHGSARITGIVSDLKDYVRSSEEKDKTPGAIDGVIEQVMTLVGKQVSKSVSTLNVEVQPGLPPVEMNAGKIEQVLINLILNAGQAADKEDAWVRLTAGPGEQEGWVTIRVEDNGSGIAEQDVAQIFEPFFTTKAEESGTGLGLAISHQIIEDHGGSIGVTSELGKGTCFAIHLPTTQAHHA